MDSSIDSGESEAGAKDLSVTLASLAVDGVNPSVGDTVDMKVGGTVSKLVNDVAFVTPTTINGQPIPEETPDATDQEIMKAAGAHDASMGGMGY